MRKAFIFTLLMIASVAFGSNLCQDLFTDTYLEKLIHELASMRLDLDFAKVANDTSLVIDALENTYAEKELELMAFAQETRGLSFSEFYLKLTQEISRIQTNEKVTKIIETANRAHEQKTIDDSSTEGYRISFGMLANIKFKHHNREFTIDTPIEISSTPISQSIWHFVAEIANAKLGTKLEIQPAETKGDTLPVTMVTYRNIQEWIGALNKLSEMGDLDLRDIIHDFKKGDRFRLPYEKEWEVLARAAGKYSGEYYFNIESAEDYLWLPSNTSSVQPVAQKNPVIINNHKFFDVGGNVQEFLLISEDSYVARGGSAFSSKIGDRSIWGADSSKDIGFRLVREARGP